MSVIIDVTDDIDACRKLRKIVFVGEKNVDEVLEADDYDDESVHILARKDGVPIGTARLRIKDSVAAIERVCILKEFRGTGLGTDIIQTCIHIAQEDIGAEKICLAALLEAIPFYQRLGFEIYGDTYAYGNVLIRDMEIQIDKSPDKSSHAEINIK